jgi:hypothetical protein
MANSVELLSDATNYAIVQLPGRKFPGVVVQGDSLHSMVTRLIRLRALSETDGNDELSAGLEELLEVLSGALRRFETTCTARGLNLPYPT